MNNSSCENDNRTFINDGTIINLKGTEYRILELKGRGASCVVYLAENCSNNRRVLIKEFYPKKCDITRDENNNLVISNSDINIYRILKKQLRKAYKLQLEFHNSDETGNYTSDAETMVEAYSTLYVIMNKVVGSSYDKVVPENITEVLEVCKSVATVIGFYHKKGYLHLDIKPDNIYVLKETNQIINLFDFDTVKLKSDLENGNYIANSNEIAAPEISKTKIDEFTGKYLQEVDERADIYAIGHILFEKVMERNAIKSDTILGKKFNLTKTRLLENSSPQLREMIQEIFRHTVTGMKSERYSNTDELIKALDQALKIATEEKDGYLIDNNITVTTSSNYYISRKDKLSEIHQHLKNYHIAYLYGIGGIGKSETAREYAEEYRYAYTTIQLSVYSGDLKALIAGLKIARSKISDDCDQTDDYFEKDINIRYETKLSLLSKAMINNERTLLIIDNYNVEPDSDEYKRNVEVMKDLKKLHIHILFTTRTLPNDDKTKINVEEFSKEELRHMFFAINPKDKDKEERVAQVDELIETAYRHTLTVDLVAHQTAKIEGYGKKTLADYIEILQKSGMNSGINVAVYNNKDENEKSAVIFEHIKALFNLSSLTEKERYIMVNACLLPLSGMSVAEFESFIDLENYPNSESSDGWGENSTITNLVKSGWMKKIDSGVSRIALHPLVAEVVANELQPEITEDKCQKFCGSIEKLVDNCKNDFETIEPYKDLFNKSAKRLMENEDEKTANYLSSVSYILPKLEHQSDALLYSLKALEIQEKVIPENLLNIANALNIVAHAYSYLNDPEKELEYLFKSLAIQEKVLPENHPDIAISLNNVGVAYAVLGDLEKSLEYLFKSLAIEKVLSENYSAIETCLDNICFVYDESGEYEKELEYLLKAVALREKDLPKDYLAISSLYSEIGYTHYKLANYEKGVDCYLKELAILENAELPEDYPFGFETSFSNIGFGYMNLRDYDKALPYMLKAASIFEQTVPKNNAQLARLYSRISKAYANLGDEENSEKYLKLYQQYNDQ